MIRHLPANVSPILIKREKRKITFTSIALKQAILVILYISITVGKKIMTNISLTTTLFPSTNFLLMVVSLPSQSWTWIKESLSKVTLLWNTGKTKFSSDCHIWTLKCYQAPNSSQLWYLGTFRMVFTIPLKTLSTVNLLANSSGGKIFYKNKMIILPCRVKTFIFIFYSQAKYYLLHKESQTSFNFKSTCDSNSNSHCKLLFTLKISSSYPNNIKDNDNNNHKSNSCLLGNATIWDTLQRGLHVLIHVILPTTLWK